MSAASGGNSEPKQGQRSQSARGFCPRSTMQVPQPDIIEHFGNADAVPQLPERCLSRKAGIVRCCRSLFLQTQPDYALKSLGSRKGFPRLFALHPACVCEISVIFFVFRYTSNTSAFMPHPLPNFMRIPKPVRVLDTRKFSEQNFWGQASCTLPCVAVYLSVRF